MRVHWFAFTFFGNIDEFESFYREFFYEVFGNYVDMGHGGRGYRSTATTANGVRLYFDPVSVGEKGNHCHIEIPGEACECVLPDTFREVMTFLVYGRMCDGVLQADKFSIKRLDFAFDHEYFTPGQWLEAISGPDVVSLAKRDKIKIDSSPFAVRDNGEIGTMTVYMGSNESGRMIRVYNKRGPTRLEMQMRDERAHLAGVDVLLGHPSTWHEKALSHVVQYITFRKGKTPDWWLLFIGSVQSADLKISSSRIVGLRKLDKWFKKQVAVALSVMYEVEGGDYFKHLIAEGKKRDRARYAPLLELAG